MNKKKNILIVIDVQNDFITGALRNEEAIKTLPNIVNLIKTQKFDDTYVTMDTHDNNYMDTLEGKKLPIPHCIKGTDGWNMPNEINEALKNQNVVNVFEKNTFGSTWMSDYIKTARDNELVDNTEYEFTMVGFCSDICCISCGLLLRAKFPNTKITVMKDLCAGTTKENHEAALKVMQSCQIDIK